MPWLAASKAFKHTLCFVFSRCYQSCSLISFPLATGEGYLSSQSSAIHLPATPRPVPQGCLPGHGIQLLGSGVATSAQVNWLQSLPSLLSSWAWGRPGCVNDAQTTFVNHIPSFTCLCLLLNCTDHISLPPFLLKLCLPFPCLENFSSKQPNSGFIWKWYQLQWSLGQGREEAENPVEVDGF